MTIDMNKKYKTRDGRDVRIMCVDSGMVEGSVLAIVGAEHQRSPICLNYLPDGRCFGNPESDLIEVRPSAEEVVRDALEKTDNVFNLAIVVVTALREAGFDLDNRESVT